MLLGVGLDRCGRTQGFVDDGIGLRRGRLHLFGVLANPPTKKHRQKHYQGKNHQHKPRKRRRLVNQQRDSAHNNNNLPNELCEGTGKGLLKYADVALKAVSELADALLVKEGQGQADQVAVHGRPQRSKRPLRHAFKEENSPEAKDALGQQDAT